MICLEKGFGLVRIQSQVGCIEVRAPVVDGDGNIEQKSRAARKVKVKYAAHAFLRGAVPDDHGVVAEKVAMAGGYGKRLEVGIGEDGKLMRDLFREHLPHIGGKVGKHDRRRCLPPLRTSQVFLKEREAFCCQMHAGEYFTHAGTFLRGDVFDAAPFQTVGDGKGLTLDVRKEAPVFRAHRSGHRAALSAQVRAQFQIEGKLLFGEPFKDGEHPTTLSRVQKIVGVLNAACNRLKRQKLPDVEVGEPGAHVLRRQCRKDGHDPNYQLNSMNFGVSSVERGSAPGRLSTGRSLRFFIV